MVVWRHSIHPIMRLSAIWIERRSEKWTVQVLRRGLAADQGLCKNVSRPICSLKIYELLIQVTTRKLEQIFCDMWGKNNCVWWPSERTVKLFHIYFICCRLIVKMLTVNQKTRISATDALESKWIQSYEELNTSHMNAIVDNIKKFNAKRCSAKISTRKNLTWINNIFMTVVACVNSKVQSKPS